MRRKRQGDETYDDYDDYGSYETTTVGGNSYDILIFSTRYCNIINSYKNTTLMNKLINRTSLWNELCEVR